MIITNYKTNLTEQQYRSQEGRHQAFSKIIEKRFENKEISLEEARKLAYNYARKLGLSIQYNKEGKEERIIGYEEIFDYDKKDIESIIRKSRGQKEIDVVIPKYFVTVGERNTPCEITKEPNVKTLMINTIKYSDQVDREVLYSLCQTPKGIKVSSPAFGESMAVSVISERTKNKCTHEFGKRSKEIGEFHTHPGIGNSAFSFTDLASFSDDPENISNSNCVVAKVRNRKGKEKIRVRCTTGIDAKRFARAVEFKDPKIEQPEMRRKLDTRFVRDPDIQNAFSCVVDINNKPTKNKVSKSNYSSEYDGKIISKERIKSSKKQEKQTRKTQRKTFKKSSPTQTSSGFLGLGSFI